MEFRLLSAAVLTLTFTCVAFASPPMTKITVEVKAWDDKPVDRASVIVTFLGNRNYLKLGKKEKVQYELKTNQEGHAKIPPITQGDIKVQVIAKGYQTYGQVFEINEEERTIAVKLNPPQQPYSAHQ